MGASVPCSRESPTAITRCFWVLPHGTGSRSSVFHAQLLSSGGTKPVCQLQEEREPFSNEERPTSSLHLLQTHDLWFHVARSSPTSPLQQGAETPEAIHGVSGDIPSPRAHPHGCCAAPSHPGGEIWGKQTVLHKAPSTLISQNPRVIKVGKDLQDLQVQPAAWPPNPLLSHVPQGWGLGSSAGARGGLGFLC